MNMGLKDKLTKLRDGEDESKIDWKKNKQLWVNSVDKLYKTIQDQWFCELEDEGLLNINTIPISIVEEYIGKYTIPKMEISFPSGCVILEPVGRNIVGGKGRIDFYLRGNYGSRLMLILYYEQGEDIWMIKDKEKKFKNVMLSNESFEKVIEKWITD
jgi:hypothetical protein